MCPRSVLEKLSRVAFSPDFLETYIADLSAHRVDTVARALGYCRAPCGHDTDRMVSETLSDIAGRLRQLWHLAVAELTDFHADPSLKESPALSLKTSMLIL